MLAFFFVVKGDAAQAGASLFVLFALKLRIMAGADF